MQADYAIELGAEEEVLELPWAEHEQGLQYYDLKRHPEFLLYIQEAQRVPELGEFLAAINSPSTIFETAKCDAWASPDMNPEEDVFGAALKFGSYVDLLFSDDPRRFSLEEHENMAKNLSDLLGRAPEIPAAAEFLVRRCHYHHANDRSQDPTPDRVKDGYYITFYLFGYDADELLARQRWAIALKVVENALVQLAGNFR